VIVRLSMSWQQNEEVKRQLNFLKRYRCNSRISCYFTTYGVDVEYDMYGIVCSHRRAADSGAQQVMQSITDVGSYWRKLTLPARRERHVFVQSACSSHSSCTIIASDECAVRFSESKHLTARLTTAATTATR